MGATPNDRPMTDEPDTDRRPDKPTEWTYGDYMEVVDLSAEVAADMLVNYPEDYADPFEAVESAIQGDNRFATYGHALMTVLLSGQNPDHPDYTEPWDTFVTFDGEITWTDCIFQMARVCYYSDVMARLTEIPPMWEEIEGPGWREGWKHDLVDRQERVFIHASEYGYTVDLVEGNPAKGNTTRGLAPWRVLTDRHAPTEKAARAVAIRFMRGAYPVESPEDDDEA